MGGDSAAQGPRQRKMTWRRRGRWWERRPSGSGGLVGRHHGAVESVWEEAGDGRRRIEGARGRWRRGWWTVMGWESDIGPWHVEAGGVTLGGSAGQDPRGRSSGGRTPVGGGGGGGGGSGIRLWLRVGGVGPSGGRGCRAPRPLTSGHVFEDPAEARDGGRCALMR